MQKLRYTLCFSSNDGFYFHDRTAGSGKIEQELSFDEFPTPEQLVNL